MKSILRNLLLLCVVVGLAACDKSEIATTSSQEISIKAALQGTKALLDQSSFEKVGNKIMVYDLFTEDSYSSPYAYISTNAIRTSSSKWQLIDANENPVTYYWTFSGTHKFFSWLSQDNGMLTGNTPESFFGYGFNFNVSNNKLTIPQKALTGSSPQFDFLYSDIIIKEIGTSNLSSVNFEFNHLFTAFGIGVENKMSSESIIIEDFKILGLYNSSNADINFNGTSTQVSYGYYSQSYGSDPLCVFKELGVDKGYTVAPKTKVPDVFNGASQSEHYTMIWPQAASMLHSSKEPVESDGDIEYPDDWKIYIKYTSSDATVERYINFPNLSWEAGKKYHFYIIFSEKFVDIDVTVSKWDYQTQIVDYSSETVIVSKDRRLEWMVDPSNKDEEKDYVYIRNGIPVSGRFQFDAPLGGTWMATLTGDMDAFTLTPDSGVINGEEAYITITPKTEAYESSKDLKVQVKFAVRRTDGRTIIADDIIQPTSAVDYTKYTIVLPANK